jgi:hypothetical protein
MAIHHIQIGKNRFVCGLFWQSLSRPRELHKEAAGLAKRIDCDLMVLRKNQTTAQAGFAHSRDGARPNACSLAAAVSETLAREGARYDGELQEVHNWLGAFKLPDGMWAYFAVRDANFLPNGDFAGTQEEVLDRLLGDYALGGWNVVIGDADLAGHGFHNFIAKPIETLIPHKKNGQAKVTRALGLRPVQKKIPWRALAAASLALAIGAAGAGYWYQKKQAEQERRRLLEEAARQAQGLPAFKPAVPHPWRTKPVPAALAQACVDKLTSMSAGGWQLDSYTCSATQASYSWVRNLSTVDFLKAHVPDALVEINGNRALQSVPLQLPAERDEALLASAQLLEPLMSRLQLLGLALQFKKEPPPPAPPAGDGRNAIAPPEWQTYTFVVNGGGLAPGDLAALFALPGVRIEKLAYQGGSWTVEGVIYAK